MNVFTEKSSLIKLPKGATLLDFAFKVHSELGLKASGGQLLNEKGRHIRQIELDYELADGDRIKIMGGTQTIEPSTCLLDQCKTRRAKSLIGKYIISKKKFKCSIAPAQP